VTAPSQPLVSLTIGELGSRPTVDFILATAVEVERDSALATLEPLEGRTAIVKLAWDESTYYLGKCGRYVVALVLGEAGSGGRSGSGQVVADAIGRWDPGGVVMVGIAFGKGGIDQVVGDVLVSTVVIPYDLARIDSSGETSRSPQPEAGITLLDRFRNLSWAKESSGGGRPNRAIRGPILSGSKLVDDEAFKGDLFRRFPTAVGGEMEGAGVYAAADRRRIEWIIIKGICDWGVNKTKGHQELAARNAADLVHMLLLEKGLERSTLRRAGSGSAEVVQSRLVVSREASALVFSRIEDRIRSTHQELQRSSDTLAEFLAAHIDSTGRPVIPDSLQKRAELLEAQRQTCLESWLNAYNDGCTRYLSGDVDRQAFRRSFGREIVELVESDGPPARALAAAAGAYVALHEVYAEFHSSRSALPVLFPAASAIMEVFREFNIGDGDVLPVQSLIGRRSSWPAPTKDDYGAAVKHLALRGYIQEIRLGFRLMTKGYQYLYSRSGVDREADGGRRD
jgi:nucleoside phosphorylase